MRGTRSQTFMHECKQTGAGWGCGPLLEWKERGGGWWTDDEKTPLQAAFRSEGLGVSLRDTTSPLTLRRGTELAAPLPALPPMVASIWCTHMAFVAFVSVALFCVDLVETLVV